MGIIWAWLGRVWWSFKRAYLAVMPIRFSFIAVVVVWLAFSFSDQGQDALRLLGETHSTLVATMFFVSVVVFSWMAWYWSRCFLRIRHSHLLPPGPWLEAWAPRVLGAAPYFTLGVALLKSARTYGVDPRAFFLVRLIGLGSTAPRFLKIGGVALIAAGFVFLYLTAHRRQWQKNAAPATPVRRLFDLQPEPRRYLVFMFVLAMVLFAAATLVPQRIAHLGSPSIVILSAALWIPFGSVVVHIGNVLRIPILTFLFVLAFAVSGCNDNHVIQPVAAGEGGAVDGRPDVRTRFGEWYAQLQTQCKEPHQHPVFIVATEGGGIRAAYWTAAVLGALHDQHAGFTSHLFAVSGVSGGSLGAGVYGALLTTTNVAPNGDLIAADRPRQEDIRPMASATLRQDHLAPTLAAMLQPDLAQRFLPFPALPDRAAALEGAWDTAWMNRRLARFTKWERLKIWLGIMEPPPAPEGTQLTDGFLRVFGPRNKSLFPSLFFNGTIVEKGNRIIASNVRADRGFEETVDAFSEVGADVKISRAVDFSTRFTYVSPAGTIRNRRFGSFPKPGKPDGKTTCIDCDSQPDNACIGCNPTCCHVVDGGYFENSGAVTAAEIYAAIRAESRNTVTPVVIFISYRPDLQPPYVPHQRGNEVLSPIFALLATRGGRGELAVAQLKNVANANGTPAIDFVLTQRSTKLPLGWALADRSRNVIDANVGLRNGPNWDSLQRVRSLLTASGDAVQDCVACDAFRNLGDPVQRALDIPKTYKIDCNSDRRCLPRRTNP